MNLSNYYFEFIILTNFGDIKNKTSPEQTAIKANFSNTFVYINSDSIPYLTLPFLLSKAINPAIQPET